MGASDRHDIRAVLRWVAVGSRRNTGGAVVEKPAV